MGRESVPPTPHAGTPYVASEEIEKVNRPVKHNQFLQQKRTAYSLFKGYRNEVGTMEKTLTFGAVQTTVAFTVAYLLTGSLW